MKNFKCCAVLLAFLFSVQVSFAQLEASNWYFGFGAGLNFDPDYWKCKCSYRWLFGHL